MTEQQKEYARAASKKSYRSNREKCNAKSKARRARVIPKRRRLVARYKQFKGCQDCGITDHRILEFDHRGDKAHNVTDLVTRLVALSTLRAEIRKCDVRCANCHRLKTYLARQ